MWVFIIIIVTIYLNVLIMTALTNVNRCTLLTQAEGHRKPRNEVRFWSSTAYISKNQTKDWKQRADPLFYHLKKFLQKRFFLYKTWAWNFHFDSAFKFEYLVRDLNSTSFSRQNKVLSKISPFQNIDPKCYYHPLNSIWKMSSYSGTQLVAVLYLCYWVLSIKLMPKRYVERGKSDPHKVTIKFYNLKGLYY